MFKFTALKTIFPFLAAIFLVAYVNGQIVFNKTYNVSPFTAIDIKQSYDSGFAILSLRGSTVGLRDTLDTFALLRLDKYGNSLWFKKYSCSKLPQNVVVLTDSGFAVGAGNLYKIDYLGNVSWVGSLSKGSLTFIQPEGAGFIGYSDGKDEVYHFNHSGKLTWRFEPNYGIRDLKTYGKNFALLQYSLYDNNGNYLNKTVLDLYDSTGLLLQHYLYDYTTPVNFIVTNQKGFLIELFDFYNLGQYLLVDSNFQTVWKRVYFTTGDIYPSQQEAQFLNGDFIFSWRWIYGYSPNTLVNNYPDVLFITDSIGNIKWGRNPLYSGIVASLEATNDNGSVWLLNSSEGLNIVKTDHTGKSTY